MCYHSHRTNYQHLKKVILAYLIANADRSSPPVFNVFVMLTLSTVFHRTMQHGSGRLLRTTGICVV